MMGRFSALPKRAQDSRGGGGDQDAKFGFFQDGVGGGARERQGGDEQGYGACVGQEFKGLPPRIWDAIGVG